MILEAVAAMLEDAGIGTTGKDIFVHTIPAGPTPAILLRQHPGGTMIDHYLPTYRKTTFMLIVRAREHTVGLDLINQAVSAITLTTEQTLQGILWKYMRPENEPYIYPTSVGGNIEFEVNIDACYVIV